MTSTGQASDIVFKGLNGNECEEFIVAIEELAFAEGWSRDRERMLLFARSRLRHKALRWFARLDPSKKNDWDNFVEALFDQYPLVEAPESEITTPVWSATTFSLGASTAILPLAQVLDSQANAQDEGQKADNGTTHSALPKRPAYDPSIPGRHIGILRLIVDEDSTPPQYMWRGHRLLYYPVGLTSSLLGEEQLATTMDRQEALLVCFLQSSEPHPIACLNTTSYLGDLSLSFRTGGTNSHIIRAASGEITPRNTTSDQSISNVWNVLAEGTVQATIPEFGLNSGGSYTRTGDFKTTEVHLDMSGASVSFVKPGTPLPQDSSGSYIGRSKVKARIAFEPL